MADFGFTRNQNTARENGDIFAQSNDLPSTSSYGGHASTASHMLSVSLFQSGDGSVSLEQLARQNLIKEIYAAEGWNINQGDNIIIQPQTADAQTYIQQPQNVRRHIKLDVRAA